MANFSLTPLAAARNGTDRGVTSAVTLTLHSVIPGRRGSGEPGIPRLRRGIPGSPFGRPGMTLSESDVGDITLARTRNLEVAARDSQMCNCTSEFASFEAPRNDQGRADTNK